MTDTSSLKSSGAGAWADWWLDAQRQYWDSCLALTREMCGNPPGSTAIPQANPGMDFRTGLAASVSEAANRWIEAQRGYWRLWADAAGRRERDAGGDTPREPWPDWTRQMFAFPQNYWRIGEESWRALTGGAGAKPPAALAPWDGFATLWGMPLDNWRRVCSAVSVLPGDMEQAARGAGSPYGPETLHQTMVGMLSMPTLGYTREWQEEWQRWGLLGLELGQALQEYLAVLARINLRCGELFGQALRRTSSGDTAEDSLRAFYNLWIDCAEKAYGEFSMAPEFTTAQSQLTNALFAMKRQEQKMVEEFLSALNMPTRGELDTSHRRVHELQRRLWRMEQDLEDSDGARLREELAALRHDVDKLQAARPSPTPPGKGGAKATT